MKDFSDEIISLAEELQKEKHEFIDGMFEIKQKQNKPFTYESTENTFYLLKIAEIEIKLNKLLAYFADAKSD